MTSLGGPVSLSTGLVPDRPAVETARRLLSLGCEAVELSGGLPHEDVDAEVIALAREAVVRLHNYFPPPVEPFVLNLASSDAGVVDRSIKHVAHAIDLAARIDSGFFSLHAGFLINPKVRQLGREISPQPIEDRSVGLDRFIDSLEPLAQRAEAAGVMLLVENNVLSASNYEIFRGNPLLMADPIDLVEVMERTSDNVRVLLDVAHLKVSAETLGFDPAEMVGAAAPWISGYHLSDNDGTADTNGAISPESWFWPHLLPEVPYWSVEVRGLSDEEYVEQGLLVHRMLA